SVAAPIAAVPVASAQKPAVSMARTPSHPGAEAYIISPKDGAKVHSPVTVVFGLKGMGVAPAGIKFDSTGHHHLLVDTDPPADMSAPLPATDKILHFGKGQTEAAVPLSPGKHTLQLLLGDQNHVPHNPQAICVRPRMQRYQEVSRIVFGAFREISPLVEGLSLDEAFLDVTASQELLGSAVDIARLIKGRICELTGLTASVGVAPNKLVAKIASDLMKPDGLTHVTPERVREVLDPLSVRRLPGLGRKTGARVEAAGIETLGELRSAPDALLWPLFGRYCACVRERASGIDDRPVL